MLGFLIAAAAGFVTPQIEGPVAGPIAKALENYITVEPAEKRLIAFMVALLVAAICAAALNTGSVFGIIIGAILGYFGLRIVAAVKKVVDGRPDAE
jgi:ABC-type microcin C transport system permease subunit YejE